MESGKALGRLFWVSGKGNTCAMRGKSGTGFDHKSIKALLARLKPLVTRDCPFTPKPKVKDVNWVKPELVCEIRFS